jgi:hypothetical protein
MKRSITRWTTTLATAALLGLPGAALAQSPSTTPPRMNPSPPAQQPAPEPPTKEPPTQPASEPPAQPTPQPPSQPTQQPPTEAPGAQPPATEPAPEPTATPSEAAQSAQASPDEHLRQAKAALDAVPAASLTGSAKTKIAELTQHMTALETSASSTPAKTGTEIAAINKLLAELLDSQAPGAASTESATPGATGTSGATPTSLDPATRTHLTEVRTHIAAYAAAKGGAEAPSTQDAPQAPEPAASPNPDPGAAGQATPPTPDSDQAAPQPSAAGAQAPGQAQAAPGQGDPDAARAALTTARDTLSQLTQLPAAGQLTGQPRAQVAQLITNFNELITSQSQWRASYDKVTSSLDTLLGSENTDSAAPPAAAPSPAPGAAPGAPGASDPGAAGANAPGAAAGSVGTSGTATATIDPSIRAKLVELRKNLQEFEKAAGGSTAGGEK